uniref:Uncharacterized protein n=1 Tax=Chromera velia CCMP2878 TaxID=1169474 RepID=A0A0G4FQ75_9ALVE|mmetsp:Transcript_42941/g.84680  ORF Transcript_42941/g.84680 Transcript_42941/m.84680 type:complete len:304 (+) Transcript_42941:102-1013(+)|eukprot:Cvel_18135.t1-p1 / transcript=Cvel_18135.t1 / gene=Cvel_18135 / organism=Chromera_velia_CCMP2878 / gene_product=hypothetical protein / transcript_product=hypothetical protein / location=Cvel_scaffold1488:40056-41849(+) / protein_length=303 / sequence_SO=supercontig / SO=protein_coding / is_pseudo=false
MRQRLLLGGRPASDKGEPPCFSLIQRILAAVALLAFAFVVGVAVAVTFWIPVTVASLEYADPHKVEAFLVKSRAVSVSSGRIHPGEPLKYGNETLPRDNRTNIAIAQNDQWIFAFALGSDGNVYEKHAEVGAEGLPQPGDPGLEGGIEWSEWQSVFFRGSSSGEPLVFDGDPAVGVNSDGRVEVFARFHVNLDVWQAYLEDPSDPRSWSVPRESAPVEEKGDLNETMFWNQQPVFPTSDLTVVSVVDKQQKNEGMEGVLTHASPQRLRVFYRGFDGTLYYCEQTEAGNPVKYTPPTPLRTLMI